MLMAVGFILVYMRWRKIPLQWSGQFSLSRKRKLQLVLAGCVIALHWITFFGAIKASNVSITLAMMSTGALFTALLEPIFTPKKFIWYEGAFGLMVIAALYYIFRVESGYGLGMILGLTSALLSAIFTIMNVSFVKAHPPSLISVYELTAGTLLLTFFFLFLPDEFVLPTQLSGMDWLWLVILASACTAYAFIGSVKVMQHLSAYTVMLTTNLEPVYGIILAFFILGDAERMTPDFYIGALVILVVIITNGVIKSRKTA
jgi:drug/metabolite transporter (DMT)-like permease